MGKFIWRALSDDGLLREPREYGPPYASESLGGYGSYRTEAEAEAALAEFKKSGHAPSERYVLVKVYD